jgi:glycosyltransferase involved in cell wall biosynthesis
LILKKKIYFIIPSLAAGGAERVMSYVSEHIDKQRFETKLIVIGFEKNKVFDVKDIELLFLEKSRTLNGFCKLFGILRKDRPDIVVTAISHLNSMMGLQSFLFRKIKFIGREVNVQSVLKNHTDHKRKHGLIIKKILGIGYKNLDKVICQSKDMKADLLKSYGFDESKAIIINNPIPDSITVKKRVPTSIDGVFRLITVGRLAKQKGHKRILEALAQLKLPFKYTIIGDGPEKEAVLEHANELNIIENIHHIPFTNKVYQQLSEHHLFLQGSYVEGFPNALLESCAIGTPAVVFRALGGIDEIIEEGVNGFLVDTVGDFTAKTTSLLKSIDNWKPEEVAKSVHEKYNSKKIIGDYEKLFSNV